MTYCTVFACLFPKTQHHLSISISPLFFPFILQRPCSLQKYKTKCPRSITCGSTIHSYLNPTTWEMISKKGCRVEILSRSLYAFLANLYCIYLSVYKFVSVMIKGTRHLGTWFVVYAYMLNRNLQMQRNKTKMMKIKSREGQNKEKKWKWKKKRREEKKKQIAIHKMQKFITQPGSASYSLSSPHDCPQPW